MLLRLERARLNLLLPFCICFTEKTNLNASAFPVVSYAAAMKVKACWITCIEVAGLG